jgi:CheY-like chemotaxis protein
MAQPARACSTRRFSFQFFVTTSASLEPRRDVIVRAIAPAAFANSARIDPLSRLRVSVDFSVSIWHVTSYSLQCQCKAAIMPRPHALIVDDNAELRHVWRLLLASEGFDVTDASNGDLAVRAALQTVPDVIVMDVAMPVMDGLEATERLKQSPTTADIPILMVSGDATMEQPAIAAGCQAFLVKPFWRDELLSAIRPLLVMPAAGGTTLLDL